jgi:pyruvate formate-lyase activating enzyme-like uncharacterized protein
MEQKIKNRKSIPELEYDVHGHCIHVGPVSYGCRTCFANILGGGIQVGQECMANCPMCYYDPNRCDNTDTHNRDVTSLLGSFYEMIYDKSMPYSYSYQSFGETLLYIDDLEKFSKVFKEIENNKGIHVYNYVYTNGILADEEMLKRLKDMEVDEIRFHISASDFSKDVIDNMYTAAKMNFIVTVEEPSWPLHRNKLFGHLPIFEDIGMKHLNIVEVMVTEHNIYNIEEMYSDNENIGIYKDHFWQLYDGGLVYEIIREVLDKGYSYSVLDCNSGVERCRHTNLFHVFDTPHFYDNGFAEYYGFDKSVNNKHYKGELC